MGFQVGNLFFKVPPTSTWRVVFVPSNAAFMGENVKMKADRFTTEIQSLPFSRCSINLTGLHWSSKLHEGVNPFILRPSPRSVSSVQLIYTALRATAMFVLDPLMSSFMPKIVLVFQTNIVCVPYAP